MVETVGVEAAAGEALTAAWQLGGTAVLLVLAVVGLWRLVTRLLDKQEKAHDAQTARYEVLTERLLSEHGKQIGGLRDSLQGVELALNGLRESATSMGHRVERHGEKLERHDSTLTEHHHRLRVLEHGSGVRPVEHRA